MNVISYHGYVTLEGDPFVLVEINGEPFAQLTAQAALDHGLRSIQAGQEAERDAALIRGLKKADFDTDHINAMLTMVRDNRDQADPDPRQSVKHGRE